MLLLLPKHCLGRNLIMERSAERYVLRTHRVPFVGHRTTADLVNLKRFFQFLHHGEMSDVCKDTLALVNLGVSGCNVEIKELCLAERDAYCCAK